jgi:hypothetical protein
MRRTPAKTAKDQKTPSRAIPREGMDHITSAQYVSVLSKKIRTEDSVPSTLPRQGETSFCRACIKLHGVC